MPIAPTPSEIRQTASWPLITSIIIWNAVALASVAAYRPPTPLPNSISEDSFSAERANRILKNIIDDTLPHPPGSRAHQQVREKITSQFEALGYAVELQHGVVSVPRLNPLVVPAQIEIELTNIIARRIRTVPAAENKKPMLLVAHYDSVTSGPGVSDDGVAVASLLEIARILASKAPADREVIFLITDGEERNPNAQFGLLGARMFVDEHPLAQQIGIVINLEARGTTGPSCMFETSLQSYDLMTVFNRIDGPKFASSLFYEIYKRLPRDTDFSIFKRAGMHGYNFAYIGNVKFYHTAEDNFENLDLGSMQHHGNNALGLTRALLNSSQIEQFDSPPPTITNEAVYFDLFGKLVIRWPATWSIYIAGLALFLFAFSIVMRIKNPPQAQIDASSFTPRAVLIPAANLMIPAAAIALTYVVTFELQKLVRLEDHLQLDWPSNPTAVLIGYWTAGFALAGAIATMAARLMKPELLLIGILSIWISLSFLTSIYVNGASYLFIIPAVLTASTYSKTRIGGETGLMITLVVAAAAIGLIWLPLERLFYDAVGFRMPMIMMGRIAFVSTTLLPLLALTSSWMRFSFAMISACISAISFSVAILLI
ncbi:M28 family peptidase [bacterium]|nr:M28 family peptidase [bacterium]